MPKTRTNVLKIFAKHTEHARERGKRAIRQAVQRRTPVPARRFRSTVLRLFFCRTVLFVLRGVCLAAARVSAPHLSMPSTRHGAKRLFRLIYFLSYSIIFITITIPLSLFWNIAYGVFHNFWYINNHCYYWIHYI